MDIASFIRHVPDYPKPGILFYDITPLLASPEAFGDVIERMADAARPLRPTRIVAAEARGFLFAAPLAQRLGVGLAPVRKPGKLPCEAFEASYDLEYGSNTLCLHKDALTPEDRVLIVDDVLATGGTLDAMIRLVGQSGATVAGCCMLMEQDALGGRKVLGDIPLSVLLHVWSGALPFVTVQLSMPSGFYFEGRTPRLAREGFPPQAPPSPARLMQRPVPPAFAGGTGRFTWNRKICTGKDTMSWEMEGEDTLPLDEAHLEEGCERVERD